MITDQPSDEDHVPREKRGKKPEKGGSGATSLKLVPTTSADSSDTQFSMSLQKIGPSTLAIMYVATRQRTNHPGSDRGGYDVGGKGLLGWQV